MLDFNKCLKEIWFVLGLLGFMLLGVGIYLITAGGFPPFIVSGTIVGGILLVFCSCLPKCLDHLKLLCVMLVLITLFLIISGILTIGNIIIGMILIALGILSHLLSVVCIVLKLLHCKFYKDHS